MKIKIEIDEGLPEDEVLIRCRGFLLYTSDAADDLLCVDLGGRQPRTQTRVRQVSQVSRPDG